MVAFVVSLVVLGLSVAAVVAYAGSAARSAPRSPGARPCVAAAFVFFVMFLAYGVVPHQWLAWADNELGWRADKHPRSAPATSSAKRCRFTDHATRRSATSSPPASTSSCLGARSSLWSMWQNRGKTKPKPSSRRLGLRPTRSSKRERPDGQDRRQPADARVPRRLRPPGGRRPTTSASRSSRSSSSTSTSPSASCARAASTSARGSASTCSPPRRSPRRPTPCEPGLDPDDHVIFVVDEDVCTRCGLCVDRCPTGVIIMGKTGVAARDGDQHQRDNNHGYAYGMRF